MLDLMRTIWTGLVQGGQSGDKLVKCDVIVERDFDQRDYKMVVGPELLYESNCLSIKKWHDEVYVAKMRMLRWMSNKKGRI